MNRYMMKSFNKDTSCHDIFREVKNRQLYAIMLHSQAIEYFKLLGLKGFEEMHKYQHLSERMDYQKTNDKYFDEYGMILEEAHTLNPKVIPSDWYGCSKYDVTSSIRQRGVKDFFDEYLEWESQSKRAYEHYAHIFIEKGEICNSEYMTCLAKDTACELSCLDHYRLEMSMCSYDAEVVLGMQHCIKEKYHDMIEDLL